MNEIDRIKELTNELLQYSHEYYDLDSPTISDIEYDKKFDELKQMEDEVNFWLANSPTRKVQGEVLPCLTKVHHSVPMLSADKSTDIEDVKKFIGDKNVVASFKLDGSTVVLKYDNHKLIQALSRGSGYDGEDITHTAKMIKNLPETIPYEGYLEIRGEALIPWEYYNEMNVDGTLGHPRNVASGGLRQLDANEAAKRNIYFYAFTLVNWKDINVTDIDVNTKFGSLYFLYDNGFATVPHVLLPTYGTLEEALDYLNREEYENPTDGWCFEFNDLAYGDSLGSTEHHDRRLFALKPELEEHTTIFREVEYQTCRTGIVSLKAVFDPVEIGNTTVSKATLHNVDFFNNLELGAGDEIIVTKMNEIIPGILENNTRSRTYKLIDTCPTCGEKLIVKNTGTANVLYCPNENCNSRIANKITHFASKKCANIEGMSKATIQTLLDAELINNFEDIYKLKNHKDKLLKLPGFGQKSVEKLLLSIENSRIIKLENFIAALGIDNIGTSAAKTISKACDGDLNKLVMMWANDFDFTTLDDFGEVTAKSFTDYFDEYINEIEALASHMKFIIPEVKAENNIDLDGKSFCVTGSLNIYKNRDELIKDIESHGGKVVGSVSKKTDYLLTNDADSGSTKARKAAELNIPIINEVEFRHMIGID